MFHEYVLDSGLDSLGIVRFLVEERDFVFSAMSRLSLGLSSLLSLGTGEKVART